MNRSDLNLQDNNFNEKNELRLQVFLSHCGVASRRAAEKIILVGRVSVNGNIITELGTKVSQKDEVLVDGKKIQMEAVKRYVLLQNILLNYHHLEFYNIHHINLHFL